MFWRLHGYLPTWATHIQDFLNNIQEQFLKHNNSCVFWLLYITDRKSTLFWCTFISQTWFVPSSYLYRSTWLINYYKAQLHHVDQQRVAYAQRTLNMDLSYNKKVIMVYTHLLNMSWITCCLLLFNCVTVVLCGSRLHIIFDLIRLNWPMLFV